MKKRISFVFFISMLTPFFGQSQVTFSEDIAAIIYENCTGCHRPGEVGPVPFTNYDEVSVFAGMIQYVTGIQYMPPYPPDVNYASYVGERTLTNEEIQLISDWADNGFPQGDPELEPPLPDFPTGSQVGIPDVVLEMSESHMVEGDNQDDYRVFVLPTGFLEDKEIAAIEFRPGNNSVVHHALLAYDITGQAAALDAATPEYGYESFGDFGFDDVFDLTWSYVPGTMPLVYPEGIGEIIPAGADLLMQVHYAPLSTDEVDQSFVNIFYKEENDPIVRPVQAAVVLPYNIPGGFEAFLIPPDEITTFYGESIFTETSISPGIDEEISLISIDPHAHFLGKSFEIYVVTPINDTINLIKIDDWDFNWQGNYTFDFMKTIPANSEWYTIATYDNTTENPDNPNSPPALVSWGEGTTEEMLLVGFYYVPYQEGDEDIVMGDGVITSVVEIESPTNSQLLTPSPNPTNGEFTVSFQLKESENLSFELAQMNGKIVQQIYPKNYWQDGDHSFSVNLENLPAGIYLLRMRGERYVLSQKLIIVK